MDVTGDGSKVQCCKEQYCMGTWNDRSMNQGKLEVVKQEMARVNVDILGISELKWTEMGEFYEQVNILLRSTEQMRQPHQSPDNHQNPFFTQSKFRFSSCWPCNG